jgi:hypothetical protein
VRGRKARRKGRNVVAVGIRYTSSFFKGHDDVWEWEKERVDAEHNDNAPSKRFW